MPRKPNEDPFDTDIEREIKELEFRAEQAIEDLAEMDEDEANRREADELRQRVEQLEAEVAQRKQVRKE